MAMRDLDQLGRDEGRVRSRNFEARRLLLPFRSDAQLREEYINHLGSLRLGLLLGDLDAFAGVSVRALPRTGEAAGVGDGCD